MSYRGALSCGIPAVSVDVTQGLSQETLHFLHAAASDEASARVGANLAGPVVVLRLVSGFESRRPDRSFSFPRAPQRQAALFWVRRAERTSEVGQGLLVVGGRDCAPLLWPVEASLDGFAPGRGLHRMPVGGPPADPLAVRRAIWSLRSGFNARRYW